MNLSKSDSKQSCNTNRHSPHRLSWGDLPITAPITNNDHDNKKNERIRHKMHSNEYTTKSLPSENSNSNTPNMRKRSSSLSISCTQQDEHMNEVILEKKKSRAICCLRTLIIFSLTTATIIVAVLTYTFTHNSEMQVFYTSYTDSVSLVSDVINANVSNKLHAAKTISAAYSSRFRPQNTLPNITMPNFGELAEGQVDIVKAIALSFNPIITNYNREEWEFYATNSAYQLGVHELYIRDCDTCRVVADGIYRNVNGQAVDDPGYSRESRFPYHIVPVWQIYPALENWRAVMFNLHSESNRQRALDDMLEYRVPTVTSLLHLVQHVEMDPSSILFYPVFDSFGQFRSIVGSISIVFTWADMLRSVLPNYMKGLIVVLETRVLDADGKQMYTYKVSGDDVTLLGEGDQHESNFDDFENTVYANVANNAKELQYVENLVMYKLRIYPSKEFQNQYLTLKPLIMTLVVMFIFVLTSTIFVMYDYLVYHRVNAIMQFAQRSGRIVNSMFPITVQERLFSQSEHEIMVPISPVRPDRYQDFGRDDEECQQPQTTKKSKMKQFIGNSCNFQDKNITNDHGTTAASGYLLITPPIADLFHNTTILFADMVTFTEWSSNHSPEDVFFLLETLFLEFDIAAERLGVFKLGTIGDCYVAVTGLPDPIEDHAAVMAHFAEECRSKTNSVLEALAESFGPSVGHLSMRFGMHSGSVIAGVLRGLKSRFELFGDTINTASRMESTGAPNKIQISEQTAKCLSDQGCDSWYEPREDLVYAKGKGYLQTYWLDMYGMHKMYDESIQSNGGSSYVHEVYNASSHESQTSNKALRISSGHKSNTLVSASCDEQSNHVSLQILSPTNCD